MTTRGKTVVLEGGKRGLLAGGKGAVYDENGECPACCGVCEPKVLGSTITNSQHPNWDLTPWQGPHKAPPGSFWRLIEVGSCYPHQYPWYGAGCVNEQGELVGLPNQFQSYYYYDGHMELQIGCLAADGEHIEWPGTCQTLTPVFSC